MQKWKISALILAFVCLLSGCATVRITQKEDAVQTVEETLFARMPEEFIFSSGAGGWESKIQLADDGSFTGYYYDYDLGETGEEYPNGVAWVCEYSGKFTQPVQKSETVWSVKVESVTQEREKGEVYYKDGYRYTIYVPRGFEIAEEFLIYLPGTPAEDTYYGVYYGMDAVPDGQYSLFNVNGECEFRGWISNDAA